MDDETKTASPPKPPKSYVVSARVLPDVYDRINAFERHLFAGTPGASKSRSAAIKACLNVTFAAFTDERMEAIRAICTQRSDTIENVLADVFDEGIAALRRGK